MSEPTARDLVEVGAASPVETARSLGFPTTSDPAFPIDARLGQLRGEHTGALVTSSAGGIVSVLTGQVPSAAQIHGWEDLTGAQVAVTVTTPEVYRTVRTRATAALATTSGLAQLLSEVGPHVQTLHLSIGQAPRAGTRGQLEAITDWPLTTPADIDAALEFITGTSSHQPGVHAFTWGGARWTAVVTSSGSGVHIALHATPTDQAAPRLTGLGLPPTMTDLVSEDPGLVLLASPAGGGRTTTARAVLTQLTGAPTRIGWVCDLPSPAPVAVPATVISHHVGVDVASIADSVRTLVRAGAQVLLVDAPVVTSDDVLALLSAAAGGARVYLTVPASDLAVAHALLFTAVPAPRAEAFHALFAAVFAGGAAQQLRVDSHGQLLPVVELLFPHAALTGALRVGDLSNMAYLASADPSGRSTSMAAAWTALRDAGRLLA